jgi:hypothetical protein
VAASSLQDCEAITVSILELMKAEVTSPSEEHSDSAPGEILDTQSKLGCKKAG